MLISVFNLSHPRKIAPVHKQRILQLLTEFLIYSICSWLVARVTSLDKELTFLRMWDQWSWFFFWRSSPWSTTFPFENSSPPKNFEKKGKLFSQVFIFRINLFLLSNVLKKRFFNAFINWLRDPYSRGFGPQVPRTEQINQQFLQNNYYFHLISFQAANHLRSLLCQLQERLIISQQWT